MGAVLSQRRSQGERKSLTAAERQMLRRLGYTAPRLEDLEKARQEDKEEEELINGLGSFMASWQKPPVKNETDVPIAVATPEWSRFSSRVLSAGTPVVIHSVVFPKGRDPQTFRLDNCSIKEEQRTRYPAGVVPETELLQAPIFEVYTEEECLPTDGFRADRFLVINQV